MLNKAVSVFKTYRNLAPPYLKQLFICSNTHATSRFITLPKPRTDLFKNTFSFSGASVWNSIKTQITSCSSLTTFETQINKWFRSRVLRYKIFLMWMQEYIPLLSCFDWHSFVLFIMHLSFVRLYTYRYTVTTRMTSALRWAAMRAILMFHNWEG